MSEFQAAAAALASLRADGIAVSNHFSGRLILAPEAKVTPNHQRIVQQHGPALVALIALQQAASRAERGRAAQ